MKNADLTAVITLRKNYFTPEITEEDFPEGIDCLLKSSLDRLNFKSSRAVLLISDNANLIRAFVNRELENSYTVYIGDPLDIGTAFDRVTDVWSPFDDGAILKKRYILLLDYIRCRFLDGNV